MATNEKKVRRRAGGHGTWCSGMNCNNSRDKYPKRSFFRFPTDPERCRQWVVNSGRQDLDQKTPAQLRGRVLCSAHFEDNQFMNADKKRLIHCAVPTIFEKPRLHLSSKFLPKPKRLVAESPASTTSTSTTATSSVLAVQFTESKTQKTKVKRGGSWCCAINCTNTKSKHPNLTFFRFPKDPERCRQWIVNSGCQDLDQKTPDQLRGRRLCPAHFEDDQFMNADKNRLIHFAVPTIFESAPTTSTSVAPTSSAPAAQSTVLGNHNTASGEHKSVLGEDQIDSVTHTEVNTDIMTQHQEYKISGVSVYFPCKPYPSQFSMMDKIIKGIERRQHCLLESPTGSGKSLALLCSSLAWQVAEKAKKDQEEAEETEKGLCTCECHTKTEENEGQSPPKMDVSEMESPKQVMPIKDKSPLLGSHSRDFIADDDDDFKSDGKNFNLSHDKKGQRKHISLSYEDDDMSSVQDKKSPPAVTEQQAGKPVVVCSLCSCDFNGSGGKPKIKIPKIFFGTRTHKQVAQIVKELRKTKYHDVRMTILGSREHTCIHPEVSRMKNKNDGCKDLLNDKGCRLKDYTNRLTSQRIIKDIGLSTAWDLEDLVGMCKSKRACPYFLARGLKEESDLIICPYNYLVDPMVREAMQINLKGHIVILDEAHNIEDSAREAASQSITQDSIVKAVRDIEALMEENISLADHSKLRSMLKNLDTFIDENKDKLEQKDFDKSYKIWTGFYIVAQLESLGLGPKHFSELKSALNAVKAEVEQRKEEAMKSGLNTEGMEMKSSTQAVLEQMFQIMDYLYRADLKYVDDYRASLVQSFSYVPASTEGQWLHSRNRFGGRNMVQTETYTLNFWCMNPGVAFSDFADTRSIILTSGTLSPLASFESELGLEFKIRLEANHVIKDSQVWVGTLGQGPTGSSLQAVFRNLETFTFQDELGGLVLKVCETVPHGVLCFLPSYKVMEKLMARWASTGLLRKIGAKKKIISEPRGSDKIDFEEQMKLFYEAMRPKDEDYNDDCSDMEGDSKTGAVFFAVCRGKVSEGLDFSDNFARAVITVGIPYPNFKDVQVELKRKYNDQHRHKKGLLSGHDWYEIQAFRALNQALGRCIRHRNDWGALIIVDDRFVQNAAKYSKGLSKWVRNKIQTYPDFTCAMDSLSQFTTERLEAQDKESSLDTSVLSTPSISQSPRKPLHIVNSLTPATPGHRNFSPKIDPDSVNKLQRNFSIFNVPPYKAPGLTPQSVKKKDPSWDTNADGCSTINNSGNDHSVNSTTSSIIKKLESTINSTDSFVETSKAGDSAVDTSTTSDISVKSDGSSTVKASASISPTTTSSTCSKTTSSTPSAKLAALSGTALPSTSITHASNPPAASIHTSNPPAASTHTSNPPVTSLLSSGKETTAASGHTSTVPPKVIQPKFLLPPPTVSQKNENEGKTTLPTSSSNDKKTLGTSSLQQPAMSSTINLPQSLPQPNVVEKLQLRVITEKAPPGVRFRVFEVPLHLHPVFGGNLNLPVSTTERLVYIIEPPPAAGQNPLAKLMRMSEQEIDAMLKPPTKASESASLPPQPTSLKMVSNSTVNPVAKVMTSSSAPSHIQTSYPAASLAKGLIISKTNGLSASNIVSYANQNLQIPNTAMHSVMSHHKLAASTHLPQQTSSLLSPVQIQNKALVSLLTGQRGAHNPVGLSGISTAAGSSTSSSNIPQLAAFNSNLNVKTAVTQGGPVIYTWNGLGMPTNVAKTVPSTTVASTAPSILVAQPCVFQGQNVMLVPAASLPNSNKKSLFKNSHTPSKTAANSAKLTSAVTTPKSASGLNSQITPKSSSQKGTPASSKKQNCRMTVSKSGGNTPRTPGASDDGKDIIDDVDEDEKLQVRRKSKGKKRKSLLTQKSAKKPKEGKDDSSSIPVIQSEPSTVAFKCANCSHKLLGKKLPTDFQDQRTTPPFLRDTKEKTSSVSGSFFFPSNSSRGGLQALTDSSTGLNTKYVEQEEICVQFLYCGQCLKTSPEKSVAVGAQVQLAAGSGARFSKGQMWLFASCVKQEDEL